MKILILDDEHDRVQTLMKNIGGPVYHATNFREFLQILKDENFDFDLIMLDHDLQDWDVNSQKEFTGSDAAKYIAANPSRFKDNCVFIIHSLNSIGVANMMAHLKYLDQCIYVVPFAWTKIKMKNDGIIIILT